MKKEIDRNNMTMCQKDAEAILRMKYNDEGLELTHSDDYHIKSLLKGKVLKDGLADKLETLCREELPCGSVVLGHQVIVVNACFNRLVEEWSPPCISAAVNRLVELEDGLLNCLDEAFLDKLEIAVSYNLSTKANHKSSEHSTTLKETLKEIQDIQ